MALNSYEYVLVFIVDFSANCLGFLFISSIFQGTFYVDYLTFCCLRSYFKFYIKKCACFELSLA